MVPDCFLAVLKPHRRERVFCAKPPYAFDVWYRDPYHPHFLESVCFPHCHRLAENQPENHWHYEDRNGRVSCLPPHFSKCRLFPSCWWTAGSAPPAQVNNVIETVSPGSLNTHFERHEKRMPLGKQFTVDTRAVKRSTVQISFDLVLSFYLISSLEVRL